MANLEKWRDIVTQARAHIIRNKDSLTGHRGYKIELVGDVLHCWKQCECGNEVAKLIEYHPDKVVIQKPIRLNSKVWQVFPRGLYFTKRDKKIHVRMDENVYAFTGDTMEFTFDGKTSGLPKTRKEYSEERVMIGGHFGAFVLKKSASDWRHRNRQVEARFFHRHWGEGYIPLINMECPKCGFKAPANAAEKLALVRVVK